MKEMTDKEVVELIDKAIDRFAGNSDELASAIGVFMIARKIGWKPTYLLHSTKTMKKYEKYLGINLRETMQDVGPKARKSVAWKAAEGISNFWKLVKGETPNVRTPDWTHLKK